MFNRAFLVLVLMIGLVSPVWGQVTRDGDAYQIRLPRGMVRVSAVSGAILSVTAGESGQSLWASGEDGLWSATFADGSTLCASAFGKGGERICRTELAANGHAVRVRFASPELMLDVLMAVRDDGVVITAEAQPLKQALRELSLPGRMRFEPAKMDRLIFPADGNLGVGLALKRAFFELQPQDHPAGWRHDVVGARGYVKIMGGPLQMRPVVDEPVALSVTDEGRKWLGEDEAGRIAQRKAVVNRAPGPRQADLVLVESEHGAYFSAKAIGEAGRVWRIGGGVGDKDKALARQLVTMAIEKVLADRKGRGRLGLLALRNGPEIGSFSPTSVTEWKEALSMLREVAARKVELVFLETPEQMRAAMAGGDVAAIVNPYGEWVPPIGQDIFATAEAITAYARAGGQWFEVGGHAFYAIMRPLQYLEIAHKYPPAFADFAQIESGGGSCALYAARPARVGAWEAAQNKSAIFVPGRIGCGGDGRGGYVSRAFATHVEPGQTWQTPVVRLVIGGDAIANLKQYAKENSIDVPLQAKMNPEVLEKFKRAVLVYYAGSAAEKIKHLDLLPKESLIHFADYLKGGFDKEYPDHLPPNAKFGSADEFKRLLAMARERGHLVMPYTNPTWWCDHPRGPSFIEAGEAPLMTKLDGKPHYERYGDNDGWTICYWHPAVRKANRKTIREFSEEYPVDLIFQDQCGARGWEYDLNAASPAPHAYVEGMLSMIQEDSRTRPLSTESGWDAVVNYQAQLCGMTWSIVPTEHRPTWTRLLREIYPARTWEVFPMAQAIAHDKVVMIHHDLGQFVTNDEVLSWSLGLGYGLSQRAGAAQLQRDGTRQWLLWLDRLQKSVAARYTGQPLKAWKHVRPADGAGEYIDATYGDVRVVASVGNAPCEVDGKKLEPFGFRISAPSLSAAGGGAVGYVCEGGALGRLDLWIYARAGEKVEVELSAGAPGIGALLRFDGVAAEQKVTGDRVIVSAPAGSEAAPTRRLWHATLHLPGR